MHAWYVCPEPVLDAERIRRYEAVLSTDERGRYERFAFDADRQRYLIAHVLLRATLSRYAPVAPDAWVFSTNAFGRPEIAGPENAPRLRFSLSHTRGLIALAIAIADVGLDVERIASSGCECDVARKFFAASEVEQLEALPSDQQTRAFYDYWTLKEAYIKAIGIVLSEYMHTFAFTMSDPPVIAFDHPSLGHRSAWQFARPAISNDHACAIAIRHPCTPRILVRCAFPLLGS